MKLRSLPLYCLWGVFLLWGGVAGGILISLERLHEAPLEGPQKWEAIQDPPASQQNSWHLIHFMAAGCPCSAQLAAYLKQRETLPNATEEVVILGKDAVLQTTLADKAFQGWKISTVDPEHNPYAIEGAPWLLILDSKGRVQYSGGYLGRVIEHASDPFQDGALLQQLKGGEHPIPLVAYGCAVSRRLQRKVDPLALKYANATP